jgi:hypothetical protein
MSQHRPGRRSADRNIGPSGKIALVGPIAHFWAKSIPVSAATSMRLVLDGLRPGKDD